MRDITSEPPKRCGFSNDASATSSPVSRSKSRSTIVVVPRSIARPWIGPVERAISSPSMRMRSPSRVTAGSSARPAWRAAMSAQPVRMRIWPRRIVWQRTSPSPAIDGRHDRRKWPRRCCSSGVGGDSASWPCDDLDDALLALALLLAGRRHAHAEPLGVLEQREPRRRRGRLAVDGERRGHSVWNRSFDREPALEAAFASSSACTASATSWAEPSRSSSSLQCHWAR